MLKTSSISSSICALFIFILLDFLFTYLGRVALQTNFYFGLKKSVGKSNELVASNRIPLLAQRVLGSPRGKQRKLLQRNIWRFFDLVSKKRFFKRIQRFFVVVLSEKG